MANEFRSTSWESFIGQEHAKKLLDISIKSAKARNATLDHTLFYGPPGIGKTTLAGIVATQQHGNFICLDDTKVNSPDALFQIVSTIQENDIVFIDEIHRLSKDVCEKLYIIMEDFHYVTEECVGWEYSKYHTKYDRPLYETKWVDIPRFTLIGATTHAGDIPKPMLDRFGLKVNLVFYSDDELSRIVENTIKTMGLKCGDGVTLSIAKRSRGVARIAIHNTERARDYALAIGMKTITMDIVDETFIMLRMDENGLDELDYRYLKSLSTKPMGIQAVTTMTGETATNIQNMVEPHLTRLGLVLRTPRGRVITEKGISYLESHQEI